jgi:hypothetical protein
VRVSIEHLNGDANQPLALHVNGEVVPFQTSVSIVSHANQLNEVTVNFTVYRDGIVIGTPKENS